MTTRLLARITGVLLAVGLAATAVPAAAGAAPRTAAHGAKACAGAHTLPARTTLRRATRATMCLINRRRAAHGLRRLRANRRLHDSAARYAGALVVRHFFSHVAPDGETMSARIARSGYLRGARGWAYGENLGWGAGRLATPAAVVRAWMRSAGHRANILSPRWRHIGVGIAPGAPVPGVGHAASYVTHFGWRA